MSNRAYDVFKYGDWDETLTWNYSLNDAAFVGFNACCKDYKIDLDFNNYSDDIFWKTEHLHLLSFKEAWYKGWEIAEEIIQEQLAEDEDDE